MSKLALITGSSRGLGKSAALELAKAGVDIIVTWHSNKAAADAVVAEVKSLGQKAVALQLDVGNSKSFAVFKETLMVELDKQWQRSTIDFLVNNAGSGAHKSFAETTEAEFDEMFNIHLKSVFFLTQTLLPVINDEGRILNVSSGLTRFSFSGYSAYATMKGAVETLTHYLAKELGPRGIRVNVIAPGAIETDFGGGAVRDNVELNKLIASQTALGRVGVPEDIGGAIAALLSEGNRWMNGQRVEISGGVLL